MKTFTIEELISTKSVEYYRNNRPASAHLLYRTVSKGNRLIGDDFELQLYHNKQGVWLSMSWPWDFKTAWKHITEEEAFLELL